MFFSEVSKNLFILVINISGSFKKVIEFLVLFHIFCRAKTLILNHACLLSEIVLLTITVDTVVVITVNKLLSDIIWL